MIKGKKKIVFFLDCVSEHYAVLPRHPHTCQSCWVDEHLGRCAAVGCAVTCDNQCRLSTAEGVVDVVENVCSFAVVAVFLGVPCLACSCELCNERVHNRTAYED